MICDYNERVIFFGMKLSIVFFFLTNQFVMVLRLFQSNRYYMYFFSLRLERILWWATLASGKALCQLYFVKLLEMSEIGMGGKEAGTM